MSMKLVGVLKSNDSEKFAEFKARRLAQKEADQQALALKFPLLFGGKVTKPYKVDKAEDLKASKVINPVYPVQPTPNKRKSVVLESSYNTLSKTDGTTKNVNFSAKKSRSQSMMPLDSNKENNIALKLTTQTPGKNHPRNSTANNALRQQSTNNHNNIVKPITPLIKPAMTVKVTDSTDLPLLPPVVNTSTAVVKEAEVVNPFEMVTKIVTKTDESTAILLKPLVEAIMNDETSPNDPYTTNNNTPEEDTLESELIQESVDDVLAYLLDNNELDEITFSRMSKESFNSNKLRRLSSMSGTFGGSARNSTDSAYHTANNSVRNSLTNCGRMSEIYSNCAESTVPLYCSTNVMTASVPMQKAYEKEEKMETPDFYGSDEVFTMMEDKKVKSRVPSRRNSSLFAKSNSGKEDFEYQGLEGVEMQSIEPSATSTGGYSSSYTDNIYSLASSRERVMGSSLEMTYEDESLLSSGPQTFETARSMMECNDDVEVQVDVEDECGGDTLDNYEYTDIYANNKNNRESVCPPIGELDILTALRTYLSVMKTTTASVTNTNTADGEVNPPALKLSTSKMEAWVESEDNANATAAVGMAMDTTTDGVPLPTDFGSATVESPIATPHHNVRFSTSTSISDVIYSNKPFSNPEYTGVEMSGTGSLNGDTVEEVDTESAGGSEKCEKLVIDTTSTEFMSPAPAVHEKNAIYTPVPPVVKKLTHPQGMHLEVAMKSSLLSSEISSRIMQNGVVRYVVNIKSSTPENATNPIKTRIMMLKKYSDFTAFRTALCTALEQTASTAGFIKVAEAAAAGGLGDGEFESPADCIPPLPSRQIMALSVGWHESKFQEIRTQFLHNWLQMILNANALILKSAKYRTEVIRFITHTE